VHWPLCAYRHSMDATLAWTIVGSVAGVAAVVSGVGFGVAQVRQARAKTGVGGTDGPLAGLADAYVSNVTGPAAGPATMPGVVLAGEVPQEPPSFQPRENLISEMRRSVPGMSVVQVVTGMRGVGKTQLAAAYARSRIGEGWRLVAWVNAGDTAKVLNGLAEVAARLGADRPGEDLEAVSAAVRHWLEADGERCLVVFDNVTDLEGLRPFLPAAGDSQVVITSIRQAASGLGTAVRVGVFTEDEALSFLADRTGQASTCQAREVADELGFLPLALAQAAAVIAAQQLDYETYLSRLRSLRVDRYLSPSEGEPYPQGVAEAVLLSLDAVAVDDGTGLCGPVMDVVSLLSTAGVPRALLHAAGQAGVLAASQKRRKKGRAVPPQVVDEVQARLAGASLLTFSGGGATVSAHRLVMRIVRERQVRRGDWPRLIVSTAALLEVVARSLDPVWQYRPAARDLVQQIVALGEHTAGYLGNSDSAVTRRLLGLRGWALNCRNELGDSPAQAVQLGEPLVTDSERVLGETHPDTLTSRNNLAGAYRNAGRLDEAIPLLERTLADREWVLGETHPDTLASRNSLALAYQDAGRLDEAIPLLERTLADLERVLGETHPDTLTSRNNLALAYWDARRLDEAIPLYERTLADLERVLVETHPTTLTSRNNLALAYRDAGWLDEAIRLLERTLADRERVLGETHPSTLTSRNNLALAYQDAGRLDEAIPLLERTLADSERVLGETHPDTLTSRNNLASAYRAAGRTDQATALTPRPSNP
jgi:tetratricopeptide (TPR) repeat protein